ncbi:uncharacterized protein A1O5_09952 [Cladophialophora psammophila CBS 110553]|uniref:C6 zinc finger domain-containing protein n=1 Tax=Cladophialophora psammophila CBS 110553 TaxID=1182543 RepID=W9WF69_9EURO|nr:uncharacterized protein A1O5_09952 [Cladophialophora psammophila CBS 110553]EXJ66757.1 hypothetical protein A1O5_09952 [Cladophialophora psammophila CBS 110553]
MVVTISWAFEHVEYRELPAVFGTGCPTAVVVNADHRRALKWYNKALVSFRHLLEQGEADNGYTLLSCILFGSFEFQQRNVGNALRLMDNAYKLLARNLSNSQTLQMPTTNTDIQEMVTAFSSRKAILMATLATPTPPEWKYHAAECNTGRSTIATLSVLDEFRKHLYQLMYDAYEVVRINALLSHDEYEMQKLRPRQQICLEKLQRWKDSFLHLPDDLRKGETGWISSYLLMQWGVSHVWLCCCLSPLETSFDEYMDEFAAIVNGAEKVMDHSPGYKISRPIFTCEVEVIPPLYFAASKCRDPILRRKALRLLREVPYRESVWAYIASPRVVEKMIAVEEGHDQFVEYCLPTGPLSLPPEERRIHHVAIIKADMIEGRRRLKFQWSKVALDDNGSLRMVHENAWLEDCIEEPSRHSAMSKMV